MVGTNGSCDDRRGHADRRAVESARRIEAAESAADNHDMWDVSHLPAPNATTKTRKHETVRGLSWCPRAFGVAFNSIKNRSSCSAVSALIVLSIAPMC